MLFLGITWSDPSKEPGQRGRVVDPASARNGSVCRSVWRVCVGCEFGSCKVKAMSCVFRLTVYIIRNGII